MSVSSFHLRETLQVAEEIHLRINEAFDSLPLAAIVRLSLHSFLISHLSGWRKDSCNAWRDRGGSGHSQRYPEGTSLSPISPLFYSQVPRPLGDIAMSQVAIDLLWSDPMLGIKGSKRK